jgi:hypothetical protein
MKVVDEEVKKLKDARFISEMKYPTWLANTMWVKKASRKWRMCVNYTNLNTACPKDPYPLPNIDHLINNTFRCKTLSFMDAYSSYNHYEVMPFGLKNASATIHRLIDTTFAKQIGRNLQVYIDDL